MFDSVFPKSHREEGQGQGQGGDAGGEYDGRPDRDVPLRLLQHADHPCWQTHAYLRFINQPYWTENIVVDVALGVDVPVLVDRQYVMSAQPAIRCIEEVAASAVTDCNASFSRYNTVVRLQGIWSLLEARREKDSDSANRSVSLLGVQSLSKMYSNMKTHFSLTSSTPAYLSNSDLQKAVDSCYKLVSDEWLVSPIEISSSPSRTPSPATTAAVDSEYSYLSGGSVPGLADSVLFAHLVGVATSTTDRRGLARIQHEYPKLYVYFVRICQEYFHVRNGAIHSELKLQGNSALYQCVLASHAMSNQDTISAVAESVFVKLVFGEKDEAPSSPKSPAVKRPLVQKGRHLVPHSNEPCRYNSIRLLKNKYSFDFIHNLKRLFGQIGKSNEDSKRVRPVENYIGIRCILFTGFVVGSFAKSVLDISNS